MMLCGVYILNIIINLMLVFLHRKSKLYGVVNYFLFLYILCGNKKIADYMNYYISYNSPSLNELIEFGYGLLIQIGKSLSLDYSIFRMILNIFFLTILFLIVNKNMKNPHLFFFFYSLFLIFMDAIQIRFFWSGCLILVGIHIYSIRSRWYILKIGLLLGWSILIHSGMISFFLLFLFVLASDNILIIKKYYKFLGIIILLICFYFLNSIDFQDYSYWISQTRLRRYLYTRTGWGFIVPWSIQFVQFIRIRTIYIQKNKFNYHNQKRTEILYKISFVAFLFLPLYLVNLNFYRVERVILFLFLYMGIAVYQQEKLKNRFLIVFFVLMECLIWLLYEIIFDNMTVNILVPLFGHIESQY